MESLKRKDYLLHAAFEKQAQVNPDKIAVIFKNISYTYEQINSYANYYANKLIDAGMKNEEIIGICSKFSLLAVIGVLAVLKSGGAYLPINPNHPKERILEMLSDSKVSSVLCEESCEFFPDFKTIPLNIESSIKNNPNVNIIDSQLSYVIYTSGSTGTPKGVMVEHSSITKHLIDYNKCLKFTDTDVFLGLYNFNVDATIESMFAILDVGGTLLICDEEIKSDAFKIYEIIKKYGVTLFAAPPVILKVINKNFNVKDTKLRIIMTGGDELVSDYIDELYKDVKLMNGYGITEACVSTLWHHVTDVSKKIPIGKPLENSTVYILDNSLSPVTDGEIGEIIIGGSGLARGYINDAEKTAEKFINLNGERVYKTGDLGKKLPDGSIEFCGRKDSQINLRGFRIEPSEIEVAIRKLSGIKDVHVMSEQDTLIAYIVSASENLKSETIKNHLKKLIPDYMVPAIYEFVSTIPRNDMGKVKNLKSIAKSPHDIADDSLTATEKSIRKIWAEILKISESIIGKDNNFIEFGGNSLLVMELAAHLNKEFNKKILVKDILTSMTILKQAELIENHECEVSIQKTENDRYPLSFAQKRILFMQSLKNNGMYNTVSAQLLVGNLDIQKFIASLKKVLGSHRIFKCVFKEESNPYSSINNNKDCISIENVDIKNYDWYAQRKYIDDVIDSELKYCFKLSVSPLVRLKLIQLSNNQVMFVGNIHHILIDGISWNILFNKIKIEYNDGHFEKPHIDYLDFCVWENKNSLNSDSEEAIYWKNELRDLDSSMFLEDPNVLTPHLDYDGDYFDVQIDKISVSSINKISKTLKVTEFSILLSCLEILTALYHGAKTGIVGIPAEVKNSSELQNVSGLFINMLPIKYDFKESHSLKNVFENLHLKLLESYQNSSYPFEKIVRDARIRYSANRSPIFQVMLDYGDFGTELPLKDCEIKDIDIPSAYSKYELSLIISKKNSGFNVRFEYCTGVFTKKFIKQFSDNYLKILNSIESLLENNIADLESLLTLPPKKQKDKTIGNEQEIEICKISDSEKEKLYCKFKTIWQEILSVSEPSFDRNLFDMGVTSLSLINAVTKMEDAFNVHLEVMDLFNCSNLKAVFDYVFSKINTDTIQVTKDTTSSTSNTKNKILNISNRIKNLKSKNINSEDLVHVKLEKLTDGTENKNVICIPPLLGVSEEYHKQRFADICSNLDKKYNVYSCMYKAKDEKKFNLSDLSKVIAKEINTNLSGANLILSWCNGGYVAFEVSKLLKIMPKKLILIDTYEPEYLSSLYADNNHSLKHEIALFTQSFMIDMDSDNELFKDENIVKELINLDFNEQLKYIQKKLDYLIDKDSLNKIYTRYYDLYEKSMNKANNVLKDFKPTMYGGDMLLFYIRENQTVTEDLGWKKMCSGNIVCNSVNGNHNTMMINPNVLAITKVINEL